MIAASEKLYLDNLKCQYRVEPIGIDEIKPRLSWIINSKVPNLIQTAYRIQVASTLDMLQADKPDLWDSGRVYSGSCIQVAYEGHILTSLMQCFWKVKVWCGEDMESGWSKPSYWSMGLLEEKDWKGSWIAGKYEEFSRQRTFIEGASRPELIETASDNEKAAAVILRKESIIERNIKKATALICGLGYYVLFINGERIGNHVLDPVFTDYSKRVNYVTYDVTTSLVNGRNCIGVVLGNGFYNFTGKDLFQFEKAHWKTSPKLLLNIYVEFGDGTTQVIQTDSTWKWSTGDIAYNSIRGGETIDKRLYKRGWGSIGYNCDDWNNVQVVPAPLGKLVSQYVYPMRVVETVQPVSLTEPAKNIFVFDFGRNITGWIKFKIAGKPGQKLTIYFNEKLRSEGLLDTEYSSSHTYGRFQTGEFILNGNGEEVYEPQFTYHGFRYVQIEGLNQIPDMTCIMACSVHTDLPGSGEFGCSNERLNQLHKSVRRTLLNSIHGMPGEEPTREKMGWNQDAQNTAEAYIYNFESSTAYIKYISDLLDSQEDNGHIPPIVPTNGWGLTKCDGSPIKYDDPWWGATLAVLVNHVYTYYGDSRVLDNAYNAMKKYIDFLSTTAKGYILDWSLGDWLDFTHNDSDGPGLTPVNQTSTAGYYYLSKLLSENASFLGKEDDTVYYFKLAKNIKEAFNKSFLNRENGTYKDNSQTAQVLPLFLGMVPEDVQGAVVKKLLAEILKSEYHITTGFIGVMPLIYFLSDAGYIDEVYKMITQESGTGWLFMVKDENSTLGENLNPEGYGSQHHPFAACIGSWFYRSLAGIKPDVTCPGFKSIIIKPAIPKGLDWVKGEYDSIHGKIISQWEKQGNKLVQKVSIPANTTALVYIPSKHPDTIKASCVSGRNLEYVRYLVQESHNVVFSIGSGEYEFTSHIEY